MLKEIIIYLFYLFGTFYLFKRSTFLSETGIKKSILLSGFVLKLFAALVFWLIYKSFYGDSMEQNDAFKFLKDGMILNKLAFEQPLLFLKIFFGFYDPYGVARDALNEMNHWYKPYNYGLFNDNQTMIRLHAILGFIGFGNYHIHNLFFNVFSFSGIIYLVKMACNRPLQHRLLLFLTLLLLPGALFWASGPLKESILLFSIGFFLYHFHLLLFTPVHSKSVLGCILGFYFLILIKNYILICLLPFIVSFIFISKIKHVSTTTRYLLLYFSIILLGVFIDISISGFSLPEEIARKQRDFINISVDGQSGSYFDIFRLEPSYISLIKNTPEALFNALLQPLPWQAHNILAKISAFENLLFILGIFLLFKVTARQTLTAFSVGLVLSGVMTLILSGLVTPVAGALVRYTIPGELLILVGLFLSLPKDLLNSENDKWKKWLS